MEIVTAKTFEEARKKIRSIQNKKKIVFSGDDELNRKVLEKERIDVLLLNQKERKDKQKQRNSGFNEVLARLAKKTETSIGINFDEIIESDKKQKAEIISRIKQNIVLCQKNKLKMKFIVTKEENKRNIYDLKSLGLVLGMPTWMTKNF